MVGCDAIRVPVPESPPAQIRGVVTGFVTPGYVGAIRFHRPSMAGAPEPSSEFWFDSEASRYLSTCDRISSSPTIRAFSNGAADVAGYFPWGEWPNGCRLEGSIRWNATTPLVLDEDGYITESFEIRPQPADPVRFEREVRGPLDLRWPRLARVSSDSLETWAAIPESVVAFARDWEDLCSLRGAPSTRFLVWDTSKTAAYRWRVPDTSVIREVMAGVAVAQAVFAAGDSIWLPWRRNTAIYTTFSGALSRTFLQHGISRFSNNWSWSVSPAEWIHQIFHSGMEPGVVFQFRQSAAPSSSRYGTRTILSISNLCPAFEDWQRRGLTDRSQRPSGNVAPFDGYFCLLDPDTLSFPEGDVELMPAESVLVSSESAKKIVVQKVLP